MGCNKHSPFFCQPTIHSLVNVANQSADLYYTLIDFLFSGVDNFIEK
jgi:hypothetical protein